MSKKHNTKVPDFSSHKTQLRKPPAGQEQAHQPSLPPAPPVAPKVHAPKTSGHRGA